MWGMFSGCFRKALPLTAMLFLLGACSRYTMQSPRIYNLVNSGKVKDAYQLMVSNEKKWGKGRDRQLYYLNRGTLAWMMGSYQESAGYFLMADYYFEDLQKNAASEAAALLVNPMVKDYKGEDFEWIMLHYYQIINYLQINDHEKALATCKRLVLHLDMLDDKHKDGTPDKGNIRYQKDAFAQTLLGLTYEAAGEYNKAWISYRNALETFESYYQKQFGIRVPRQLVFDLIRMGYRAGFKEEADYYREKYAVSFDPATDMNRGNLVFFWNTGLAPYKEQYSLDFIINRGAQAGWVTFANPEFGFSFPVYVGNKNTEKGSAFSQLEMVRASFPRYAQRAPVFYSAALQYQGQTYRFEQLQDVNQLAVRSLQDRFLKEAGSTLLRVATKKVSEYALRNENETAGAVLGLVNAATEHADIRNWQTLPCWIFYTRLDLPEGKQEVSFHATGNNNSYDDRQFTFDVKKGIIFHSYQTLQSVPLR